MTNGLEKQVYIYSVDTCAFYNEKENKLHRKLLKSYRYRNYLKSLPLDFNRLKDRKKFISQRINSLNQKLQIEFDIEKGIRTLRKDAFKEKNIISIFDSVLTRTLNIKQDYLSQDVIVVRAFHYKVLESIISHGFISGLDKYVYFSSSAGQIRNKKGVFIKEALWDKYNNTLTCGLSVENINNQGGINLNKYQSYLALTNSASVDWKDFSIEKAIVVEDLETNVHSLVDYINRDTYEITRQEMKIPIEHTDGFGLVSPQISSKAFMVRLPWIKGLLAPVDFRQFAKETNSYIVKDIYNKEWHIEKDDIQVIFTKSQFKLWKYYKDWQEYKDKFSQFNCNAAKLNEEDTSNGASFNYQMLQTLTDISNDELEKISESTINDLNELGSNQEVMLKVLGATRNNKKKNHFQEALFMFPELLNDEHSKQVIKDKKKSLIKDARSGKLNVNGKYTYIIPDVYAFMEYLFLGIQEPKGLLSNQEVYCNLYEEGKVDVLRSPHLYREHGIRINKTSETMKRWFITSGIYTSVHDNLSRLLQYDNDGDKALVIQDANIIEVAERNMLKDDIVPLYYEMAKAGAENINSKSIYESLVLAYKANIGEISNNITKIWNSDNVDLNVIKWLCMSTNFEIDFAKTLFKPSPPEKVNEIISKYIKNKVPYFFIHAKDKLEKNVEALNNSTVNRLGHIIKNKRISFNKVAGRLDYNMLMNNEKTELDFEVIDKYKKLDSSKKWMIESQGNFKSNDKLYVYKIIKEELLCIKNDEVYITDVLIKYLYGSKNSKHKTTLWESFGDVIVSNLIYNLNEASTCFDCKCRFKQIKQRQTSCEECQNERNKINARLRKRRQRKVINS